MERFQRRHAVLVISQRCGLCVRAEALVLRLAPRFGVSIDVVDTAADTTMADDYGDRVPVLLAVGGKVLAEGAMTGVTVQAALLRVRLGL
ncbi:MAG: glutaredoxin family protein [Acidimicrobiia bacterium]|nr:glutaredoxin family protein [Acidimicrobiia bacterium]